MIVYRKDRGALGKEYPTECKARKPLMWEKGACAEAVFVCVQKRLGL